MYHYLPNNFKNYSRRKLRISNNIFEDSFIKDNKFQTYYGDPYNSFENVLKSGLKFGLHELLRYEDRNSMAHSIESRVPFLDHRLVEFSLSLPTRLRFNYGFSKYILRKAITNKLPNDIVWRKGKKGFIAPQSIWKKELLKKLILFSEEKNLPDFISKNKLSNIINENNLNQNKISEFWRIFSFLIWIDTFKVR